MAAAPLRGPKEGSAATCYTRPALPGDEREPGRVGAYLALFSEIGTVLLVTVLAGILAGYWIDTRLGTVPIFALLGFALGLTAGSIAIYRVITRFLDRFE